MSTTRFIRVVQTWGLRIRPGPGRPVDAADERAGGGVAVGRRPGCLRNPYHPAGVVYLPERDSTSLHVWFSKARHQPGLGWPLVDHAEGDPHRGAAAVSVIVPGRTGSVSRSGSASRPRSNIVTGARVSSRWPWACRRSVPAGHASVEELIHVVRSVELTPFRERDGRELTIDVRKGLRCPAGGGLALPAARAGMAAPACRGRYPRPRLPCSARGWRLPGPGRG